LLESLRLQRDLEVCLRVEIGGISGDILPHSVPPARALPLDGDRARVP
jgi:hypothetical protein